jgi:hypothetical protein
VRREQFYIDEFQTLNKRFGYNMTDAGRCVPTEDGRRRIGAVRKGKTLEEILGSDGAAARRADLRSKMAGSGNPRYGVRGAAHPFHGKTTEELFGEDVARKMKSATSTAHKGKTLSAETKAKMSAARKGKPLSAEHRQAIAEGLARNYAAVGPRTFDQKYGTRSASVRARIAGSVSRSTKGSKKPAAWVEKMKARRCPVTGRLLSKGTTNADF